MPEQQQSKQNGKRIQPFTLEIVEDNCRTVTINTFRRRVRSRFSVPQLHSRPGGGRDLGKMNAMPEIPGVNLIVKSNGEVTIYDPLSDTEDPAMIEKKESIVRVMNMSRIGKADGIKVTETAVQRCSPDQFKTLLTELHRKVNEEPKYARVINGTFPSEREIDELSGRVLNDPWNSNPRRPKYEDEVEQYETELDSRQV